MPSYRHLQQFAIAISIASVLYNGAEGGLSVVFGVESNSRSLLFFGIQSGIEVISAILVLWRFRKVAKPGDERGVVLGSQDVKFEKVATIGIGLLLLVLAIATESSSIAVLALRQHPSSSNASLIISASALLLMTLIWLPKRYLAKALNSSTMQGEATCSLSCIQLTFVLFVGSLLFRVWKGGWWVDGATSIVLGLLFAWEGVKMLKWALSNEFTGGCCQDCRVPPPAQAELGEVYRDICECCVQKEECRNAVECKCASDSAGEPKTHGSERTEANECCTPVNLTGQKCCTRDIISSPRIPEAPHHVTASAPAVTALPAAPPSTCCGDCK